MAVRTVLVLTLALGCTWWVPAEESDAPPTDDQARKELEERLKTIPEGENNGKAKAKAKTKGLKEGKAGAGEPAQDGPMLVKFMERFDQNGDGKLDEAERAKAHEAREKKAGLTGAHGDEMRKKAMERFDANKDGKLDDQERSKAQEEFLKQRVGRDRSAGKHGGADNSSEKTGADKNDSVMTLPETERAKAVKDFEDLFEAERP